MMSPIQEAKVDQLAYANQFPISAVPFRPLVYLFTKNFLPKPGIDITWDDKLPSLFSDKAEFLRYSIFGFYKRWPKITAGKMCYQPLKEICK